LYNDRMFFNEQVPLFFFLKTIPPILKMSTVLHK